jgi:hypothetical protein
MLVVNDFPKDWSVQSFTNNDTYYYGESRNCIGTYIRQDKKAIQKVIKYGNKPDADRAFPVLKKVYFPDEYNSENKLKSYIQHADRFDAACEKLDNVIKCTAIMQYGFSIVLFDSEISPLDITDIDFANIIKKIDEKYLK